MKIIQKILSLFLICIIVVLFTSCSDNSWALKFNSCLLSPKIYLFYLINSKKLAKDELLKKGISMPNLEKDKIKDKIACDWIYDKTANLCKDYLAIEKIFKDSNLTLSDEENKKIQSETDTEWDSSGTYYENNTKIDKETIYQVYLSKMKKNKIFQSMYGKNIKYSVSDDELTKYYKDNYISIKTYFKTTLNSEPDKESQTNNEESIQKLFSNYAEEINSGNKNIDQLNEEIKHSDEYSTKDSDPIAEQLINIQTTTIPTELIEAIKNLKINKASYIKINNYYIFLYKNAAGDMLSLPDFSDETKRNNILHEMKDNELNKKIDDTKNNMKIEVNKNVINQFDIKTLP